MADRLPIAAIDAGSNGIRMLLGEVDADGRVQQLENFREAVRLGTDAFGPGLLTEETIGQAVRAFERFGRVLREHRIEHLRAVATSATRESKNRRHQIGSH